MNLRPPFLSVIALFLGSSAAWSAEPAKADPAKAQQIASQVCAACHGADGNSSIPVNPNLAAQIPEYTAKQLANFKSGGTRQRGDVGNCRNPVPGGHDELGGIFRQSDREARRRERQGPGRHRGEFVSRRQCCDRHPGLRGVPRTGRNGDSAAVSTAVGAARRVHHRPAQGIPNGRACQRPQPHDAHDRRQDVRT